MATITPTEQSNSNPITNTSEGDSVSDVANVAARIASLEPSAAFWSNTVLWLTGLTAFVAFLYFSASVVSNRKTTALGNAKSDLIAAKDRQLALELKERDERIAIQQERAANAERDAAEAKSMAAKAGEGTAKALADAADANKTAEGFRLDIAKANERAAAANETAERERLARLQLEARLADRVITDDQKSRMKAALIGLKGQTADVGVFGDSIDIANVSGAIRECLASAGVLMQNFSPLGGGGGVRGVLVGVRPDASPTVKSAAESFVAILRETLGGGVALWDFAQLDFNGSAMTGNSEGALPQGKGPLRIWIGGK